MQNSMLKNEKVYKYLEAIVNEKQVTIYFFVIFNELLIIIS